MVGIKDFEMPNTCGDCPYCIHTADEKRYIGYCNTSDDDYYCKALDRFMEYDEVDGGVDILGKPSDCPLVEAIPKADYEARLKADMYDKDTVLWMFRVVQLEIKELRAKKHFQHKHGQEHGLNDALEIIQEIISELKGGKE